MNQRRSSRLKHELTGELVAIKTKQTSKGECGTFMCVTALKNKFWFMGWLPPWYKDDGDIDFCDFVEGQTLTITGYTDKPDSIKVNEDGTKMMFLSPNPKLVRVSPLTVEMKTQKEYRNKLGELDNLRLASAIVGLVDICGDRLDPKDEEFARSLAEGAAKYESVTDKQRIFVVRLCAKYVTKDMKWRGIVDASLKSGASMSEKTSSGPGQGEGDYDSHIDYGSANEHGEEPPF